MTSGDLRDLRVAVGVPPRGHFGGLDYGLALSALDAFKSLGMPVEVVAGDDWNRESKRSEIVSRLKSFAPHFAIGLPNASYGLYFTDSKQHGARNLFTDVLSVPLVLIWDHLLTQAPAYFLDMSSPESCHNAGALALLRSSLAKPLNRHYSPDSAHIEIYESLGLVEPNQVRRYIDPSFTPCADSPSMTVSAGFKGRVGFAGNIYTARGARLEILESPLIRQIDDAMVRGKQENWAASGWDLFLHVLQQVPPSVRESAALTPDYPFFWKVAQGLIGDRITTAFRLLVLESMTQRIDFYGNFSDPDSSSRLDTSGNVHFCGSADYLTELPNIFRKYELWIDVINAPFIRGCGQKVLDCFAAGSLMLIDYRDDLRREFGELAERFMYRNVEELRKKTAFYLAHPSERVSTIEEMQSLIRAQYSLERFYSRVCSNMIEDVRPLEKL